MSEASRPELPALSSVSVVAAAEGVEEDRDVVLGASGRGDAPEDHVAVPLRRAGRDGRR
jgi:hypothetical protein